MPRDSRDGGQWNVRWAGCGAGPTPTVPIHRREDRACAAQNLAWQDPSFHR
jgi:hypothetical protein